jgi:hypothetical protein
MSETLRPSADLNRDATAERQEREAFVVLLHLFNVSGGNPELEIAEARFSRDLALDGPVLSILVDHLVISGHVHRRVGGGLFITAKGAGYIERAAGSRRSVRHTTGSGAAPGLSGWVERGSG